MKSNLNSVFKPYFGLPPYISKDGSISSETLLRSPNSLSIYAVYEVMTKCFGRPNGAIDPVKMQWSFCVKGPNAMLEVTDWKLFTWLVRAYYSCERPTRAEKKHAKNEANLLVQLLTEEVKKVRIPVEKHSELIIENVFKHHYEGGNYYLDQLEHAEKDWFWMTDEGSRVTWSAITSYILSVEAIFNLIYELNLKPSIADNVETRSRINQFSIVDKWNFANLFCSCYQKPLKKNSIGYSKLRKLISLRNDLVHANITEGMRTYMIEKDRMVFPSEAHPIGKDSTIGLGGIKVEKVKEIKRDVDLVVFELVAGMKPSFRNKFKRLLKWDAISVK